MNKLNINENYEKKKIYIYIYIYISSATDFFSENFCYIPSFIVWVLSEKESVVDGLKRWDF